MRKEDSETPAKQKNVILKKSAGKDDLGRATDDRLAAIAQNRANNAVKDLSELIFHAGPS